MKAITFVDQVRIQVFAGKGGNGSAAMRRAKFEPHGGPDGGDGGNGGSVWLVASKDVASLLDLHFAPIVRAESGEDGRTKQQYGRGGQDKLVPVPLGTEVRVAADGEWVGEVVADGDRLLVAKGGRGGLGNLHFKSSTNQAPRECTPGEKGETRELTLTMKTVAEIGLVGYPNAGKSTLLSALSAARPKVAPYPFTTLHPQVGTVAMDATHSFRIADIPGLIEGAHEGVGLGHDFLRHIERTKVLVFVLDMAGTDGREPADDYASLLKELELYDAELAKRPSLVVANKMDEAASAEHLATFRKRFRKKPMEISAVLGEGVDALRKKLGGIVFPGVRFHEF